MLRVILLTGQAREAQRFIYQMLYLEGFFKAGEVLSLWCHAQSKALSLGRGFGWHNTIMALESSTGVGFTSSSSASLTFLSCLCLFKSCLLAVGKCQSIMCSDGGDHSQSAQRTEFQVLCGAVGWCQSEASECVCPSSGTIGVSY